MAIATISNTGGLYSASSSWVGNFVPTSVDDVISTVTSGPLTVDIQSAARSVNFGSHTSTLTMNAGLTVSGNVTLGLTMSISGTYGLVVNSSATMSSNGKTWPNQLTFAGSSTTFTLIDDWVVDSLRYSTTSGSISTTNEKTITASNGLTIATTAQITGTTKIILTGGTWSHTNIGRISMPIDLSGNINLGSNIYSGGGTISYVSGTINSTGNTFSLQTGTLGLVNTNSINFNNFLSTGTSVINGSNLNILGNLTINSSISGNSTIVMKGSGTWSGSGILSNNLTFDSGSNRINVSGTVYKNSGTVSYVSGSMSTVGSTLYLQTSGSLVSLGFDTGSMSWNDMYFHITTRDSTMNLNLSSGLNIAGTLYIPVSGPNSLTIPAASFFYTFSGSGSFNPTGSISIGNIFGVGGAGSSQYVTLPNDITLSSFQWNSGGLAGDPAGKAAIFNGNKNIRVTGNFTNIGTVGTNLGGNCTVELFGSGNFTLNGASTNLSLDINSSGTYSFLSTPIFSGSNIRYLSGRVTQPANIYFIGCTLSTSGLTWSSAILRGNTGLIEELNVNNILTETTEVRFLGTNSVNVVGNLTTNISTTGSNTIFINGTSSQTWSGTSNLANNLVVNKPTGTFSISGTVYYSNGTFSYLSGAVSTSNSTFAMNGSSNLSTNGITWSNISNTATGNINLLNNLTWTGTWSATTGTITFTGSGLLTPTSTSRINFSGSSNVTTPDSVIGFTFSNITITTSGITTLRGNLLTSGLLTLGGSGNINSSSGLTGSITTTGGLSMTGNCSGTAFISIQGGTWSASGANYLNNNLRLEGNSIISSNVYYQSGTLSYISGLISVTGSTLNLGTSCKIDSNGIVWNNITNTTTSTVDLPTDMVWSGTWTVSGGTLNFTNSGTLTASSTGSFTANGNSVVNLKNDIQVVNANLGPATINRNLVNITGNLAINGTTTGTSSIIIMGTSSQTWTATSYLGNNLTINKPSGTFSISGTIYYQTGTLKHISGSVSATTANLWLSSSSCTLDTKGDSILWNKITMYNTLTVTLNSNLNATTVNVNRDADSGGISTANITFVGNGNTFTIGTFNIGNITQTGAIVTGDSTISLPTTIIDTLNFYNNGFSAWPNYLSLLAPYLITINGSTVTINNTLNVYGVRQSNSPKPSTVYGGVYLNIFGNSELILKNATISINGGGASGGGQMEVWFYPKVTFDNSSTITFNYSLIYAVYFNNTLKSLNTGLISSTLPFYLNGNSIQLSTFNFNNFLYTTGTITLLSDANLTKLGTYGTTVFSGIFSIYITDTLNIANATSGSNTPIIFTGTGNKTWTSTAYLSNNVSINTGTYSLSIGSNIYYQTGTLSYVSGVVSATGSTLSIGGSTNLQTNPIQWFNINNAAAASVNLIDNLSFTGTWSAAAGVISYTGSGLLTPTASSRINFSGSSAVTVPDSVNGTTMSSISLTTSGTTQLRGTISCSELLTLGGSGVINNASGFTGFIKTGGGLSMTGNASGTATIILNGGTWSATGANYLSNNLRIDGDSTISSNVYYQSGTISYVSGVVNTANSTLNLGSSCGIDSNGLTWSNITNTTTATVTLPTNLLWIGTYSVTAGTINFSGAGSLSASTTGNVSFSGSSTVNLKNNIQVVNATFDNSNVNSASMSLSGNLTVIGSANPAFGGNSTIIFNGTSNQSWSTTSLRYMSTSVNIDKSSGILILGTSVYFNGRLTYINGVVDTNTNSNTFYIDTSANLVSTNLIKFWNFNFVGSGSAWSIPDTYVQNQVNLEFSGANSINGGKIYTSSLNYTNFGSISGTSIIEFNGIGTWRNTNSRSVGLSVNINCNRLQFVGSIQFSGTTFSYTKGNVVTSNSTLILDGNNSALINMNKVAYNVVQITSGNNIRMNEFFSGLPNYKTSILPSSTGTYSVIFTDNFEKVARYVNPTNLWVKQGQLLITTDGKKSFSTNRGIRYINSSPNGLSKNINLTSPQLGTFVLNDPTMVKF